MAYYCGECAIWQGSSDKNTYGERWCAYSGRYEKSDQNTYGCRGFVYAGRAVLTRVCEILNLPTEAYFRAFDEVKERYLAPHHMEQLVAYSAVGPMLADKLAHMADRESVARDLLARFIEPAMGLVGQARYEEAAGVYRRMVTALGKV